MNIIREIQIAQIEINNVLEQLIQRLQQYEQAGRTSVQLSDKEAEGYETIYSLTSHTAIFKGKKPTGIIFNGERRDVGTWKKVFELILKDCVSNSEKHLDLLNLRGKVSGRDRVLLSDKPDNMRSPFEISKYLFIESHYDTESLLRILTSRILDPVGYDYTAIKIAVRNNS